MALGFLLKWPSLVTLLLVVPYACALSAADSPEEIEARLERLKSEIGQIQERLDRDLGERDRRLETVAETERQVSSHRRAVRETAAALAATAEEIVDLDRREQQLQNEVADHAQALAAQLAVAYRQGSQSRLKMLLNQDDPRGVARRLAYHGYLTRARFDAMARLERTLADLATTTRELIDRRDRQQSLLARERAELEDLETALAERERAVARLDARISEDRDRIAQLEADAAELSRLLEELATALADVPPDFEVTPFPELRGSLPVPVEGRLAHAFGQSRSGELAWNGWLIRAPAGSPVQAVAHGRVAYAEWLRGYGLLMILDHGDGYMSLYAHNESLLRDVGDWVEPGETISTVGNTGGADETGVYFELRRDGRPIDPVNWVAR